ncbi:MAG: hypothetical protein OMOMHJEC_01484 [Xanthomonadales bacterium]|nr:hypothetical protein [Xanthomonadales bacterium]
MSLFSWLSRPAWQSRDAARRAEAVATGQHPAMLAELPQILRGDPELRVRRAALERIDDLTLVADRMSNDGEASMRERARTRLLDLLVGAAPLAERLRALGLVEDPAMLEHVAKKAVEAELRRAALERCKRPGFIAERVLEDSDPGLRLELVARIDQSATLERLAQQARTRDKRLYKAIRERLDASQLQAGALDGLLARAEALCVAIEQQLRHPGVEADAQLAHAEREYASLRERIDDRFDKRFAGATGMLRAAIAAIARIGEEPVAPTPAPAVAEPPPAAVAAPVEPEVHHEDPALLDLVHRAESGAEMPVADLEALERRWQATWARRPLRGADDAALATRFEARLQLLRAAADARAAALAQAKVAVENAIVALDAALEASQLGAARTARAQGRRALEAVADAHLQQTLARRLAGFDGRIEKLAQWQRWSDNKLRVRLCEEVEALIGSGMHPDALANKIAELKLAWKRIDDSEADPGQRTEGAAPPAESGLARRFRFLCHKALEPARGYFEKRKEVRGRRSEEIGAFLERARAGLEAAADTASLLALKREAGDRLRRVDEIDPRQRGEIGRRLKQWIEACSAAIDQRFAGIAEEKHKLVAQLRRQLAHAELDDALDLAKSAQKRWQSLGKAGAKVEQALWSEFRALVDPLFERRNEELKAVDASRESEREAAQALVASLQSLAAGELDAAHLEAEIATLSAGWNEAPRPRELERGWEQALVAAQQQVARRREAEARARERSVEDLAARIDALEPAWLASEAVDLDAIETAARALDARYAQAFEQRLARLRSGADRAALTAEQARLGERLLLEYEHLGGVESPAGSQSARLNLQVEKLAARMSSGMTPAAAEERAALDLRWWALGPLTPADRKALVARREHARSTA